MYNKIRKLSLLAAFCLFAVCLSGATVMLASAEEQNYYVCFSNQNYSVRNANKMEYVQSEYVLKNIALSSAVDFYVTDNFGMRWYARDDRPLKVDETGILNYDILFSPDVLYENGSHISYRFYQPESYSVSINDTTTQLSYNPYHTSYDLYYISSIALSAGTTVSYNDETHTVTDSGYYRILFTPEKTISGNKYLFDENGNYGSGDDYKYSVYIDDAPQYYAVLENVTVSEGDTQINGQTAVALSRYENNIASAEYRSAAEVFAPERDFGIKYRVYELNIDGSFRLIDDDNNDDTEISKITVSDSGWYALSLTDIGEKYLSVFVEQEKNFGDWYLAGEFNGYCFDNSGNIDLSENYKFAEIEDGDDDYDEDYTQYIAYLTVGERDLKNGAVEFYITDGKTKFKDGADYIEIKIAGTYKIICSEEHNYGRGRNFRYVLQDENKETDELLISSAGEFITFAENCSRSADYSVNLKVYLTADIDFAGKDFVPVGTFSGTFYGGYHKLKNITYTDDGSYACVFETLTYTATVERLTVENITLGGKNTEIAGVIGTNYGKVYGVYVSGKITGKNNVGGVVAVNGRSSTETGDSGDTVNKAIIDGCKNQADITGETFVGGICGRNTGNISSCENSGIIKGNKTYSSSIVAEVGGVAGYSLGKIYDCVNTGKTEGGDSSQYVGGIVGLCVGEVYFSINRGNVSADKYVGGIVGYYGLRQSESSSLDGIIGGTDNSEQDPVGSNNILNYNVNYGDVCANSYVGGIVGNVSVLSSGTVSTRVLKIYNCASVGNLEANAGSYVGGIAGYAVGVSIKSCLSTGTIQAKGMNGGKYVGGIVGYGGNVAYSMSAATLKGVDYVGGIAGFASSAVNGCYTNAVLLPSADAEYIGGIAGFAANYNSSKNEFTELAGNYYVGTFGGISGTDYAASFNNAAVCISSEALSSAGTLPPVLCEEFSREYWQSGKCLSYPVLRNFEQAEECTEFDDEALFNKLFGKNAETLFILSHNASEITYTVTFMEWNKDNGDLYDDGLLQTDNFDIVAVVRTAYGQNVDVPSLIFAHLNASGKYVYEGDEARYFVCFPIIESVNGNLTIYAEYREIVTSLTDSENRVFAEGEFVKGTEVSLVKIGEYYTVKFTLDGEEITVENITLKYSVGENAEKFEAVNAEGRPLDCSVSGRYISFDFTSGDYFAVKENLHDNLPFWGWLLIGIGGTAAVAGLTVLTVYLIIKKKKQRIKKEEDKEV